MTNKFKHALVLILVVLVLALVFFLFGQFKPVDSYRPVVTVVHPKKENILRETVVLPASISSFYEADIYPRISGYVEKWFYDLGAEVKKGDVLARLAAPEIDKAYFQASARYHALKAQYRLAKISADRWQGLLKDRAVSQQETDEKVNIAHASYADMLAAKASRDRWHAWRKFKYIRAPFSGRVTLRNIDMGDLVNPGQATSGQKPMFHMIQNHRMRLYVHIPQNYIEKIPLSSIQHVHFEGRVNKKYKAYLENTSHALDPHTRTLTAKFVLKQEQEELLPGAFVKIYLPLIVDKKSMDLPLNTLIFRAEGVQVATVDAQGVVTLKSIQIGRDFGHHLEVLHGLNADDEVIMNPYDAIANGDKVQVKRMDKHAL